MKRISRRVWSIVLSGALVLSGSVIQGQTSFAKGKMKLNRTSAVIKVGKQLKLKVKNTKKKVKWSSNKKKIATVSAKGVVKAKKKGKVKITAKVGKKKLVCKVTVLAKKTSGSKATKVPNAPTIPEMPAVTEAPEKTNVPSLLPTPGVTNDPSATAEPGTTNQPGTTDQPGTTNQPGTTAEPGTTNEPGATNQPGATSTPDPSTGGSEGGGQNVPLPEGATVFAMGTKSLALGMSEADVKTVLGTSSQAEIRTGHSPQGFSTIAYNTKDYSEYLLFYLQDNQVVGICGIGKSMSFGEAVAGMNGNTLSNSWQNSSDYKTTEGKVAARKAAVAGNEKAYAFYDALGDNTVYCIQVFDSSRVEDDNDMIYGDTGNLTYNDEINQGIATEIGKMLNAYRVMYSVSPYDLSAQGLIECAQEYCDQASGAKIYRRDDEVLSPALLSNGVDYLNCGEAAFYSCSDAISFANSMIEESSIHPVLVNQEVDGVDVIWNYAGIGMSAKASGSGYHTYVIMDYTDEI